MIRGREEAGVEGGLEKEGQEFTKGRGREGLELRMGQLGRTISDSQQVGLII